jgi:2,5-diketo-D-gluconate reductase B
MEYLRIKNAEVPSLGLGTYRLTGEACVRAVGRALSMGYRHVDTAQMYGNEAEVGRGIGDSGVVREEIFLTTKVWRWRTSRRDPRCHAGTAGRR